MSGDYDDLVRRLQDEADNIAFRQAVFDKEELPEKPALKALIVEAREIRRNNLVRVERAINLLDEAMRESHS